MLDGYLMLLCSGSQGRLIWVCGHCAVGIYEANFSSDLGQFDLEAESHSSGISEQCVCISVTLCLGWRQLILLHGSASVFGGDPSARQSVLFSFPSCSELMEGIFTKFCIIKKNHLTLIATTHPVCTHWWLSPTASTSSTHSSCSWVGVCSQCKLQEMKKQLPNHPLLFFLLKG